MPTSSSTTMIWLADMEGAALGRFAQGQDDAHVCAMGFHVLDHDVAVVLLDDLLHDREAEARCPWAWW